LFYNGPSFDGYQPPRAGAARKWPRSAPATG